VKNTINIWELGQKINIKVSENFLNLINIKIKEKYPSKTSFYKEISKNHTTSQSTIKNLFKKSYSDFVDLEIIIFACNILKIPLNKMQKNIIAYKARRGWNYIEKPKLPIKISPIFDMLIAHHVGDGNVTNPKRGRQPYFSYRQFGALYRNLYIKKMEFVFGKINYRSNYCKNENTTKINMPAVVSQLFSTYTN